ncbi:MAG: orotidine-5'-phosphate decarboxylase [Clostridiaceae bacterium]|jgi:orotidine-5'-phosphate decarboxylase|nr:orotidine-5'-phosphate decarboxylase [Bacillota bacterium]NLN51894.1 orotidine-5'-phosphate decarboxylase [Clostridiaceae bacterium]
MLSFSERLTEAIQRTKNPTVLGLDPKLEYIPKKLLQQWQIEFSDRDQFIEESLVRFNSSLIESVHDIIPAVKPQIAYYEMYGLPGLKALERTIGLAKENNMLVILDGKRNDIGSTASAYAAAWLGKTDLPERQYAFWDADALTVNAYLGIDGIKPFIDAAQEHGKGLFVLVRTSNPSAADFQDLELTDGRRVYEVVAETITKWSKDYLGHDGYSPLGAVVGATWPEQAEKMRHVLEHSWILVPGYGAQGGTADDCAKQFKKDGTGAIVNASRSLICAYNKHSDLPAEEFAEATRREALRMRDDLNNALKERNLLDA